MKAIVFTSVFILQLMITTTLYAQWSNDPEAPGIVCDIANIQNNPQAFEDGEGGVFVFWLDRRNDAGFGARDVYGQHYNMDGYALWEEDGRQIISHDRKLDWFKIYRIYEDEIIVAWTSEGDSLTVQRLDEQGTTMWANDLVIGRAIPDAPTYILSLSGFELVHNSAGYCASFQVTYMGGSNGNRITRFSSDGVLTGLFNGEPEGNQYYVGYSGLLDAFDSNNSVYLYYSGGNGAGAMMYCLKVNPAGDSLWGPLNILEGTSGLSYQFSAISDENGVTFVWQGNGVNAENLYARRVNADGSLAWNGETITICDAEGNQGRFFWKKSGQNYYIVWADGRPGVSPGYYDIYAQKFDVNGLVYWADNGLEVASMNTYLPYPEFEFSDNNSIIVCHQSTTSGFVAHKVLDDGTLAWGAEGRQISIPTFNPFYQEHTEVLSGNNVIAAWSSGGGSGNDNIYISRIDVAGATGLMQTVLPSVTVFPNPSSGNFSLEFPNEMTATELRLFDLSGRELDKHCFTYRISGKQVSVSLINLDPGVFILRAGNGKQTLNSKLILR